MKKKKTDDKESARPTRESGAKAATEVLKHFEVQGIDRVFQTHPGLIIVTCRRCKTEVYPELELGSLTETTIAFVVWKCPDCGAKAEQWVGVVDPRRAIVKSDGKEMK